uniref:Uncharacterized protein n=1 Tax=Felis catus TaxID=9685 RepID=A0ABI7YS41_FELCA
MVICVHFFIGKNHHAVFCSNCTIFYFHQQRTGRKGCTRSFRNPAELSPRPSRDLILRLRRAPRSRPRAAHLAAASSPCRKGHTWGPAPRACLLGPNEPAALPASPGLSREASPCFVCPRETPPRAPRPYHSGSQTQVTRGTGHRSGGMAASSPSMTWRGPRRRTWTRASACPPRTSLWSLRIPHPVGSAAPGKQPSPLQDAAATGPSPGVPETDHCPLGAG